MNRRTANGRRGFSRRAGCSIGVAVTASFIAMSALPQESEAIAGTRVAAPHAAPDELRGIINEAYIYGFPIVDSYRIQYSYFVDQTNPEYKGRWNALHNVARLYTPQDKAIQTPNSDTPYSFLGADLRAEPLVISVPAISDRYYSLQFVDMYTHNFAYVGSRPKRRRARRSSSASSTSCSSSHLSTPVKRS